MKYVLNHVESVVIKPPTIDTFINIPLTKLKDIFQGLKTQSNKHVIKTLQQLLLKK